MFHLFLINKLIIYHNNSIATWKVNKDGTLLVENTFGQDVINALKLLGHKVSRTPYGAYDFGAAQMIAKKQDGYAAGSEPRRDGQAVAF